MARKRILYSKQKILMAIEGSHGIISTVAKRLGCCWNIARDNIRRFPEAVQALENENEKLLDFVESKAINAISGGDGSMIRYYLSTKGRKRGYVEKDMETQTEKVEVTFVDDIGVGI